MASILTFEQIGHSTNRLAMTDMDVEAVLQSLKIGNQKGRDLQSDILTFAIPQAIFWPPQTKAFASCLPRNNYKPAFYL